MPCLLTASPLVAYLADDPDLVSAARDVLASADLVTFTPTREGGHRLAAAADALATAVANAGVRPDRAPAAAAALLIHIHRSDRGARHSASVTAA